jgi:regulator of protease activity HflC (stomatin/prohibitin superfamily)
MLPPGLHLGLPWPFGAVRHVELGVIHTVSLSFDDQGGVTEIADASSAEGDAPASANRLWDKEQPSDVSYVVASQQQDRQSFQTVSVNAGVQYRIGLSDAAGYAALYREAAPDVLVRVLASRMLTQFFAAHTLPEVLGDSQAVIATDVRTRLQQALDGIGTGIEIVAVVIEAIHPPSGAATAYRNVQAAEIEATTAIATERGRAQTTASVALLDARDVTDDASAAAAETVSAARADLIAITADDRPYRTASQPFLLERYFSDVKSALTNVPLVVVDHRVGGPSPPTIDLRPPGTARDVRPNASAAKGNKAAAGDNVP